MFKIPHTEKAVYNGQGKPDCDQVKVNIFITIIFKNINSYASGWSL